MNSRTVDWTADRAAIDRALVALCDRAAGVLAAHGAIGDAIRYSLVGGGKRLRGLLFLAAYRAAGGASPEAVGLAAAIEVVHAYSLVHDDLPCMDDDDMRRGRATVHRVFSVAEATAAGVAMVPLAAGAAYDAARAMTLPVERCGQIVAELMRASGAGGMIGGQLLDLEGEGKPLGIEDLERIHRAKTGALIRASVVLAGIAARVSPERSEALGRFGDAIGLAFQITDDVLDLTATTDRLGKTAGRDVDLRKSTYPALLGIEGAKARAEALVSQGTAALGKVGMLSPELDVLARFAVERES